MKTRYASDRAATERTMGRSRNSRAFLLSTGLSGLGLSFFSLFVSFILAMKEAPVWAHLALFVALGAFLGIVSWSAVAGGVAPLLLFVFTWDSEWILPATCVALGGGAGLLLQRKVMAHRR